MGSVVHDDRGNASVEWRDAPADFERTVLQLDDRQPARTNQPQRGISTRGLSINSDDTFNPYTRVPDVDRMASDRKSIGTRTDLRRLSAWIKMMRQLEEQKCRTDGEDEES
ncbi:MAG TPA: hypothetical protein VJQ47_01595 [Steroidobacteraceae bacterium]|nr:hypothetical protein [Steroidobacteraceae bacterium]